MKRTALIVFTIVLALIMIRTNGRSALQLDFSGKGDPTTPYSHASNALIKQNLAIITKSDRGASAVASIKSHAKKILRLAPMSETALLHQAYAEIFENGKLDRPELLTQAVILNPRNRTSITLLTQYYIDQGDFKNALESVSVLYELNYTRTDDYLTFLNFIDRLDSGKKVIFDIMSSQPIWGRSYIMHKLVSYGGGRDELNYISELMNQFVKTEDNTGQNDVLIRNYLMTLIKQERYERAHVFWTSHVKTPFFDGGLIYNSHFNQESGTTPFDWRLSSGSKSGAEYNGNDGLYVFHNSEKPNMVASQIFRVEGRLPLNLRIALNSPVQENKARFKLRFICRPLNTLWFEYLIPANQTPEIEYIEKLTAVPEGCDFVHVQIWATPGKFTGHSSVILKSVAVSDAGKP